MGKMPPEDQHGVGSGKPTHRPAGKARQSEEWRASIKSGGPAFEHPTEKEMAGDLPPTARSEHDQPPGGFRRGVASRVTFVPDEEEEG